MQLLRGVPGLQVLDGPEDHVFDLSLFFDTKQHLTGEGARIRTAKLIGGLRPWFAPAEPSQPRMSPRPEGTSTEAGE